MRDRNIRTMRDPKRRGLQAGVMRRVSAMPGVATRRNLGRRLTDETKERIAVGVAAAHERGAWRVTPTGLELALRTLLCGAGYGFEEQKRFGRYVVDAFVPELNMVFEADGMFWFHHQDAEQEARRDAYLVARGAAAVVHLRDEDLESFR